VEIQVDVGSLVRIRQDAQVSTITPEGTMPIFICQEGQIHGIVTGISKYCDSVEYEVLIGDEVFYVLDSPTGSNPISVLRSEEN